MRLDAGGRDMDQFSPTLRRYHQMLWSRPLPGGTAFDLDAGGDPTGDYLVAPDGLVLASDSLINSMTHWSRLRPVLASVPEDEQEAFRVRASSVAATGLWPKRSGPSGQSINQARGQHPHVADRLDLTVECVRRHYIGEQSPLANALNGAADFFALWPDWRTWITWWLLDDLLDNDGEIRWLLPFSEFGAEKAWPTTPVDWRSYRDCCFDFIERRAARMVALSTGDD